MPPGESVSAVLINDHLPVNEMYNSINKIHIFI